MANFFAELKRRHIYRVAAAYAVVAWVLLQLVNNLAPVLELPSWIARAMVLLLAIGFPVALVLAWVLELKAADATTRAATGKLDWFLAAALVVVIALVSYQQLAPGSGAKTAQQANVARGAVTPGGISLAVLPFVNLSGDTGQEFFSDGMTEEITSALAKVQGLIVIGRTSAFQYKGRNEDLRAIGQALRASYLIEGSVRKAGDRVRITAQLIQAESGAHLWTENYDRQLTDIFATQEDIAQAIAGALKVPLGLAQGDTLVRDRTKDLESYDQFLRARALYRAFAIADAIPALEKLVAREPGFAPAWATLSLAYIRSPSYAQALEAGPVQDARRLSQAAQAKAEMAARRTIQLDPKNAGGYGALAAIQDDRGRWSEADDLFRQALALDPTEPDVLNSYITMLHHIGRLKEALGIRERLQTLEPLVSNYKVGTGLDLQLNGQYAASISILEAIPPDAASSSGRDLGLARAYAATGRYGDAADTLLLVTGNEEIRKTVGDAARLLRQAPTRVKAPEALPELPGALTFVYSYVGAAERYLDQPERRFEIRGGGFDQTVWLPELAPLRKTERFKAFARKAGLVDYWRARGWPDLCRPMGADDFVCD